MGDEKAVYADKAYESKERRKRLRERGINDRIMHRSHKNQAELPYWQQGGRLCKGLPLGEDAAKRRARV